MHDELPGCQVRKGLRIFGHHATTRGMTRRPMQTAGSIDVTIRLI